MAINHTNSEPYDATMTARTFAFDAFERRYWPIGRYPDALLATPKYYYVASEIMVISSEFRCHKRVVGLPPAYF